MLKIVNAFIKDHRQELGLKGYSKMSYLEKLKYLEGKVKGTKYEREIGKLTKPRVDEGIKKVLDKSGRGKNVRVKKEKKPVDKKLNKEMKSLHSKPKFTKLEEAKPSQTAVAKPKLKPKPKGKVKKAVAKIEEEIDKPKPSVKGKTYYLELDIKELSPSLLKFAEEKGWEVYEKTSEKVYIKKKMTTDESLDDDIWGSRKSPGALRSSRGVKLTDKKEKVIPSAGGKEDDKPKPKPKANTLDKDLFMDGLNIASTLGKSKGTLFELKANERITRYSPSFNLNRKNSKINKFLNKEGFVLDDKEGRRFYFQKRMTLSEAEDFVNKMKKLMKKDNPDLLGFDFNSDKNNLLNNFENADDGF